jgi:hypothetical protein
LWCKAWEANRVTETAGPGEGWLDEDGLDKGGLDA